MTSRLRASLAFLTTALYAFCYVAIKAGLPYAPPLRFAALRAVLAGVTVLAFVAATGQAILPPRRLLGGIFVVAAAGTTLGFGAMFLSPGRSGAGLASVLGNTTPLLAIVLAALVLKERVTRPKAVALAVGFAGAAIIAVRGGAAAGWSGFGGTLIPLIAASAIATESVAVKRLGLGDAVLRVAGWQLLLGSVPLFAVSAWLEVDARIGWTPTFLGLLLFVAVPGTAVATSLWYWLVQGDEVGRLSLYLFLVPVLGLALGAALFGERLGVPEIAGIGLILIGIAAAMRDAPSQADAVATSTHEFPS